MKGVLLMAYGTPRTADDVEAYYAHIRGGRKPSSEQLDDLAKRYRAIGGASPLMDITEGERAGLQRMLEREGSQTKVYAGMKHSPPFIAEVVKEASGEVEGLLCIALAPHYSAMSVGSYIRTVEEANASLPRKLRVEFVRSWHTDRRLVRAWADRVRKAEGLLPARYALVFTAHSLPARILSQGDPYRDQLLETSRLVAAEAGKDDWTFAFQSASHTSEPWLGPDIIDHLKELRSGGQRAFLIAPVGFVSDHLEILYDLDVEAKGWARESGAQLERCGSLNDSAEFIECLNSIVVERGFR